MQQSAEGGRPPGVVPAGPHSTETPDDIFLSQSEFQTPPSAAGYQTNELPRRPRSRLGALLCKGRLGNVFLSSSVDNTFQSDYPNHHPSLAAAAATSAAAPQGSYLTGAAAGRQWRGPLPGVAFSGAAAAPGQTPRGAAAPQARRQWPPHPIMRVPSEERYEKPMRPRLHERMQVVSSEERPVSSEERPLSSEERPLSSEEPFVDPIMHVSSEEPFVEPIMHVSSIGPVSSEEQVAALRPQVAALRPQVAALRPQALRPQEPICYNASVITQVSSEEEVAAQAAAAASHANGSVAYPPPNFMLPQEIRPLLGPQTGRDIGKKTLVLDLDQTLIHSDLQPVPCYAFNIICVGIDGQQQVRFVSKRPGVDEFLLNVSEWFELVVFTASIAQYANQVIDKLDPKRVFSYRLFRESCTPVIFPTYGQGPNYVKDLSRLGRDLGRVIIIDDSPVAYLFNPYNAVKVKTWFGDASDRELSVVQGVLRELAKADDVRWIDIRRNIKWNNNYAHPINNLTLPL